MFLWCQAQTLTLLLPSSISEPSATPQCLWLTLTFSFVSSTAISTQFDYFIDIFSGQIPPTNPTAKCLDGSTANFSRFANTWAVLMRMQFSSSQGLPTDSCYLPMTPGTLSACDLPLLPCISSLGMNTDVLGSGDTLPTNIMLKPAAFRSIHENPVALPDSSAQDLVSACPPSPGHFSVPPASLCQTRSPWTPLSSPDCLFLWKVASPHIAPEVAAHSSPSQAVSRQSLIPQALSAHGLQTLHIWCCCCHVFAQAYKSLLYKGPKSLLCLQNY